MHYKYGFLALLVLVVSVNTSDYMYSSSANCTNMVVCNCNVKQDSNFTEAIKALETKLDKLIALVNKTSPPTPQPTQPPGELPQILFVYLLLFLLLFLFLFLFSRLHRDKIEQDSRFSN